VPLLWTVSPCERSGATSTASIRMEVRPPHAPLPLPVDDVLRIAHSTIWRLADAQRTAEGERERLRGQLQQAQADNAELAAESRRLHSALAELQSANGTLAEVELSRDAPLFEGRVPFKHAGVTSDLTVRVLEGVKVR